jgi:hypothetical protein
MVTLLLREVFQSIFVQAASTVVEQPTASPVNARSMDNDNSSVVSND